jgi:hypothetical protein
VRREADSLARRNNGIVKRSARETALRHSGGIKRHTLPGVRSQNLPAVPSPDFARVGIYADVEVTRQLCVYPVDPRVFQHVALAISKLDRFLQFIQTAGWSWIQITVWNTEVLRQPPRNQNIGL